MPIITFENLRVASMSLTIEPWGETHAVPHLATAGIRYVLKEGAEDRCSSSVSDDEIVFWCNADSYEIDIVYPSAFDRLSWDICVDGGWCGWTVDGTPKTVEDLLPEAGTVTAAEFAILAVRADAWPTSEPIPDKHLHYLEAKFIEHVGASSAAARDLRRNPARPFDKLPK